MSLKYEYVLLVPLLPLASEEGSILTDLQAKARIWL